MARQGCSPQLDRDGKVVSAIGIMSDVNAEKQETAELQDRAERDSLTGLFNQRKVRQCIEGYFDERTDEDRCAIIMIDIDDFKSVNDTYGHICGDEVLQAIAHELERVFRSGDIVARVGGDEFLVFMRAVRIASSPTTRTK